MSSNIIRNINLYDITAKCDNDMMPIIDYMKHMIKSITCYKKGTNDILYKQKDAAVMMYDNKNNTLLVDHYFIISEMCYKFKIKKDDVLYIVKHFMKTRIKIKSFHTEESFDLYYKSHAS
jgi:hypothetical protein